MSCSGSLCVFLECLDNNLLTSVNKDYSMKISRTIPMLEFLHGVAGLSKKMWYVQIPIFLRNFMIHVYLSLFHILFFLLAFTASITYTLFEQVFRLTSVVKIHIVTEIFWYLSWKRFFPVTPLPTGNSNKLNTFLQGDSKQFPALRFWWIIIATLYHLMLSMLSTVWPA